MARRERNPRRVIMGELHKLAMEARNWRNWWDTPSYAYDNSRDAATRRDRRPEEYPENQVNAFYRTGAYLDSLITALMELRQYVADCEDALKRRQQS